MFYIPFLLFEIAIIIWDVTFQYRRLNASEAEILDESTVHRQVGGGGIG